MEKILLVEDELFFREMYSALITGEGYEVDCASCGYDGLSMIASGKYGLVVTDLVMPDISGLDILAHIRENYPAIDVILVTGNANLESAIFALKHGARDYLVKPVNPDVFKHSIAQCLLQRRLLDENEELKSMLALFQSCQSIAGCLDLNRIHHLLVESVAREFGVARAIGLFPFDDTLELQEVMGMPAPQGASLANKIISILQDTFQATQLVRHIPLLPDSQEIGISEAYLIDAQISPFYRGVIALFNDPGAGLPDVPANVRNVEFLIEQSAQAFKNVETVSQARDMLFIDDVSGLFNHRYLEVALDREIKRAERYSSSLAVLFIDVDAFKLVNDTHGHQTGTQVLAEFGTLLKQTVRDVDIVIRYGGDEYTVILVETTCQNAGMVAERIRRHIEEHRFMLAEGYEIRLTCSIGYACFPDDTLSKNNILEMADTAMYEVKSSGKNCIRRA